MAKGCYTVGYAYTRHVYTHDSSCHTKAWATAFAKRLCKRGLKHLYGISVENTNSNKVGKVICRPKERK